MVKPQLAGSVDIADAGDAFPQRKTCFVYHRHEHTVDDEPRCVIGKNKLLAKRLTILAHDVDRGIGSRQSTNDFNQPHDGNGIEKMHTNEPCRIW